MPRFSVFIDENSIFHSSREFNIEVDYKKLLDDVILDEYSDIIKTTFYMAVVSGNDSVVQKQKGFITWLRNNGFRLVTKKMVRQHNGEYASPTFSAEMSADMVLSKDSYDVCVLVGGDDNLVYTMNKLSALGKRVLLVGFKETIPYKLKNSSDDIIDLEKYSEAVSKDSSKSKNSGKNKSVEKLETEDDCDYEGEYENMGSYLDEEVLEER